MKKTLFFICLMLLSTCCFPQTTPQEMIERMGRGINLGNVLSAPVEGNWAPKVYERFFTDVANEGFTNVRIPTDFFGTRTSGDTTIYDGNANTSGSYTGSPSDYNIDPNYLDRVTQVINWALDAGLVVTLDFHGAQLKSEFIYTFDNSRPEYTAPTSAKRLADVEKFQAIWNAIANRFKNHSENLLFEIINEPYFHMSASDMNTLNSNIINTIRSTGSNNTTRNIIITGGGANSYLAPLQISNTIINSDAYLIATFHYYRPFNFTSSSKPQFNVYNWGTDSEKATLQSEFDEVLVWSNQQNIPVYLGEFGADNENGFRYNTGNYGAYGGPVQEARVTYHRYVAEQAIQRGFSFSAWCSGNKSNKTIHKRTDNPNTVNYNADATPDTTVWVEDVKNALLFEPQATPICDNSDSNIIRNPNFECGYNVSWDFLSLGNTTASFVDATTDARSGNVAAKIDVLVAQQYNKVLLKNQVFTESLIGKKITISCYAKNSRNGKKFKIRVKSIENGQNRFVPSPAFEMTTSYPENPYEFEYLVRPGTTAIEVQIMCGKDTGIYYFDDFEVVIENALSRKEFCVQNNILIYKDESNTNLFVNTEKKITNIKIYDISGRLMQTFFETKTMHIADYKKGMYILMMKTLSGDTYIKKVML